jgi:uncharacterized protein with HEPN domain
MSNDDLSLQTILVSIDTIQEYSFSSESADDFYHDRKSFDACMIHFINIGEMIERLSSEFKISHNEIPWMEIKNFRNLVAHNYFGIDADEIWDIIQNHLPQLKKNIQILL